MDAAKLQWIQDIAVAAALAKHVYPEMAACEAALESSFGQSELAREGRNLFGLKLHRHSLHGYLAIPTKEFLGGEWVVQNAQWMKYDTIEECFEDRMATLQRLAGAYPHYAAALVARDAIGYVTEVSKTWSTDPERAAKVIAIFNEYFPLMERAQSNHQAVQDAAQSES
jgi:flagellum-specific peptidoglycan hydrolase FlgJ